MSLSLSPHSFFSVATNLDPRDNDPDLDLYLKDLESGAITLISSTPKAVSALPRDIWGDTPVLSGDGSKVAFLTDTADLDPRDTDQLTDLYLKELSTDLCVSEAVIDLPLGVACTFELTPRGPERNLRLPELSGQALILTLEDPEPESGNALYFRWGELAGPENFNRAVSSDLRTCLDMDKKAVFNNKLITTQPD